MSATSIPNYPNDNEAYRFPVSVKGVVFHRGRVALLKNPRDEWELPGGKLEPDETPEGCLAREIEEELGLRVRIGPLLDTWVYHIHEGVDVLIVTYGCQAENPPFAKGGLGEFHSAEHQAAGLFGLDELGALPMPEGYKQSVRRWWEWLGGRGPRLPSGEGLA